MNNTYCIVHCARVHMFTASDAFSSILHYMHFLHPVLLERCAHASDHYSLLTDYCRVFAFMIFASMTTSVAWLVMTKGACLHSGRMCNQINLQLSKLQSSKRLIPGSPLATQFVPFQMETR
jgi:hypothetical protein